jgi:CubicO group peptidase (beta-lactamase class C family)
MRALTGARGLGFFGLRIVVLVALVAPACSRAPATATTDARADTAAAASEGLAALEGAVGAILAGDAARGVHGVVAIARGGELAFARGYGEGPHGPDTRFAIASITKPLTAACVLALVDRGVLTLGTPARTYVKELPAGVTVEHLLAHTSGLASYTDEPDLLAARASAHAPSEILARIARAKTTFAPGTRFSYSNSNYFVLGLVIEKATGRPYEDVLRELVLAPAGMTRTTLIGPRDDDEARGTTPSADGGRALAPPVDPTFSYAAAGLRSTARDLFAFDRALGGTLLTEATRARMLTPGPSGYALGWDVRNEANHAVFSHEGGIDGFSAYFARVPDLRLAVAVLLATDAFMAGQKGAPAIGEALVKRLAAGEAASLNARTP